MTSFVVRLYKIRYRLTKDKLFKFLSAVNFLNHVYINFTISEL